MIILLVVVLTDIGNTSARKCISFRTVNYALIHGVMML